MVDLAVARVCATLLAAIATTASADSGPRPQQGATAGGDDPLVTGGRG